MFFKIVSFDYYYIDRLKTKRRVFAAAQYRNCAARLRLISRGVPISRQDAKGQWIRYEYDKAIRLTALVNENSAVYRFAYDASDRLSEEVRVDNLTRRFSYDAGGNLVRLDEIGYGENGERPERNTLFERDAIGRLLAKVNRDARQDFEYDEADRLLSIQRTPSSLGKQLGITDEKLSYRYDLLGRLTQELTPSGALDYEYDPLSNLTTLTLPDGRQVNHLYYGSGHLHQLNLDGQVISDMERDDLHREVFRTQGKLTSCFGFDAMGRKAWQFASTLPAEKLSQVHNPGINTSLLVEHAYNPIHRRYQYDPAGELVRTLDKLRGEIKYEYEANGQLHSRDTDSLVGSEEFRYDAAANRLDFNARQFEKVQDNRIKRWRDHEYRYDPWGNLIEKRSGDSKLQSFSYDCENRLVRAETLVNGKLESTGQYRYDSLGRRVAKQSEINGITEQKRFLWLGLRMLREETPGQSILYLYEPGSYAPLARVDQAEGDEQKIYYFHTDQIGTPLELSNSEGEIVWQATYRSWGAVEQISVDKVEQNLRFQGQYLDEETAFHYNIFRYYDSDLGRFVTQDPIGLEGGYNLYLYAPSAVIWIDPLGLCKSAASSDKGRTKAMHDLERNGFKVVAEEVTMKVNGSRVRADFVARDAQGNLHIFEVKQGSGSLTKNQKASGVFDMSNPANTTQHLGGGVIKPSSGTTAKLKIDTKSARGKLLGGKGAVHDAVFNVLKYR
nr:RHS repeat-associated core domain-containing protein [Pseudomonas ceruminis]